MKSNLCRGGLTPALCICYLLELYLHMLTNLVLLLLIGLQPTPILKELRDEKNVEFYFGKINGYTDKMIRRFNELLGPSPNPDLDGAFYIKETPMDPGTMMAAITSSVSRSMADSISSSSRTESKRRKFASTAFLIDCLIA